MKTDQLQIIEMKTQLLEVERVLIYEAKSKLDVEK